MTAPSHRPPGIVVGLRAEARIVAVAARRERAHGAPNVRCAFGDPAQVAALAEAGVPALISFGLAGGLDPSLASGALVLADSVVLPNGDTLATDPAWRERVRMTLAPVLAPIVAPVVGSDELVGDLAGKASLWRRTAAAAVDTESHTTARVARQAGLALLVLRAIADPATGSLPPAVRRCVAPGGRLRPIAVVSSAVLVPSQVPDLIRLARHARAAMASLRRAVDVLGARFGFDDAPDG